MVEDSEKDDPMDSMVDCAAVHGVSLVQTTVGSWLRLQAALAENGSVTCGHVV